MNILQGRRLRSHAQHLAGVGIHEDRRALHTGVIGFIGLRANVQSAKLLSREGRSQRSQQLRDRKFPGAGLNPEQGWVEHVIQLFLERHNAARDAQDHHEYTSHKGSVEMQVKDELAHQIRVAVGRSPVK